MAVPADVVGLAVGQLGYHEGRDAHGNWDNVEKYVNDLPSLRQYQGQSWCAIFVSWLALKAGMSSKFPCTASCSDAVAWWQQHNRWGWKPQVGAQVFFGPGGSEHTGVVESFTDTHVTVISGNANDGNAPAGIGNSVHRDTYTRTNPYVYGYGYPAYDTPSNRSLTIEQRISALEAEVKALLAKVH
jgi:hypothetical protein